MIISRRYGRLRRFLFQRKDLCNLCDLEKKLCIMLFWFLECNHKIMYILAENL